MFCNLPLSGPVREFEIAVRLQPSLFTVRFELAMALGRSDDTTAAIQHLQIAANAEALGAALLSTQCI
jgi:hypothetical protein